MTSLARSIATLLLSIGVLSAGTVARQADLPPALVAMADAERAFAQRATVVGWKQAFLEYFADDAVAFEGTRVIRARDRFRAAPDPPKDQQLLWEPRFGDISADGNLGWLTGPTTTINPARDGGVPRYGNYASVWQRQPDGTFKVVLDLGVTVPSPAPFAPGFTRAPATGRYQGEGPLKSAIWLLREAEGLVNQGARRSLATAFAGRIAEGARFHRAGVLPLVGEPAILDWLKSQPRWTAAQSRIVHVAASRDFGYAYGTYAHGAVAARGAAPAVGAERGFYARVWTRDRGGTWTVVLDVLQPQ